MRLGNRIICLFTLVFMVVFIWSCETDSKEYIPDVSGIEIEQDIIRYEQLLAALDTNNLENEINMLKARHPAFTEIFFSRVLPFVGESNEDFLQKENLLFLHCMNSWCNHLFAIDRGDFDSTPENCLVDI